MARQEKFKLLCWICRYWDFGQCCHTRARGEGRDMAEMHCAYFQDPDFAGLHHGQRPPQNLRN